MKAMPGVFTIGLRPSVSASARLSLPIARSPRPRRAVFVCVCLCIFSLLPLLSLCAGEGEALKLEYKLKPGTELRYKLQGSTRSTGAQPLNATVTGSIRMLVCEVDERSGVALLGALATLSQQGGDGGQEQQMVLAFRMDCSGKLIKRKQKDERNAWQAEIASMLRDLENLPFVQLEFPTQAIGINGSWKPAVQLFGDHAPAVHKLIEIRSTDGRKQALIRGEVSEDSEALQTKAANEFVFDLDRGVLSETKFTSATAYAGGNMRTEIVTRLEVLQPLPAEQFTRELARFKALDSAVSSFFLGDFQSGIDLLEKLSAGEQERDWQQALLSVTTLAQNVKQMSKQAAIIEETHPPVEKLPDDQKLLTTAREFTLKSNYREAVATYRQLAEKHPQSAYAIQALQAAAEIASEKLKDRTLAETLRDDARALREKTLANETDPLEIYELARKAGEAGQHDRAAKAYARFLTSDSKDNKTRVLAQYRMAEALEKLKRTPEALAAYKAVEKITADDDSSAQMKRRARMKALELDNQ